MPVKKIQVISLLCLAAFVMACVSPSPVTVVNNIGGTSVSINFAGAGVASNVAECSAIKSIRVEYVAEISIASKDPYRLAATPLDANGKQREKKCDEGDGIHWDYSHQGLQLASDTSFETTMRGLIKGTYTLNVRVGDANGSVPVTVNP